MDLLRTLLEKDEQNVHDVAALVKQAKMSNETRQNTRGFALENDDGSIVKVFVRVEQAEDFERALSKALYDAEEDGIEIPEVLFALRQQFDIVDVEWGKNSIPEDEEKVDVELDRSDDASQDKGGEGEDDLLSDLDTAADGGEGADDLLGLDAAPEQTTGQEDIMGALTKVLDMLRADAEAKEAEAKARQAEAEAKIAQETNKAASLRAAQEEEVLDMEEYNKKQTEMKKMSDTRDKLIKYRHDLKKGSDTSLGESMDMSSKKYPEATPEEEEILDMKDWEKEEKEKKKDAQTREKLIQFRHEKKKKGRNQISDAVRGMKAESLQQIKGISFAKFNQLCEKAMKQ